MTLEEYLAVPYVLDVRAVCGPDGEWVCQVEYEELPGCKAQARSPLDALDELERQREEHIRTHFRRGLPIPVPRPPLTRSQEASTAPESP